MVEAYKFITAQQQEVFERKFEELDLDGNGVITLQELFKRMYRGKANRDTGRLFMQVRKTETEQSSNSRADDTLQASKVCVVEALRRSVYHLPLKD